MPEEPIYSYNHIGFQFDLYPNRIEVTKGLGGRFKGFLNKEVLLLRSITNVATNRLGGKLIITMVDGRKHEFGFIQKVKAEEARDAIVAALP